MRKLTFGYNEALPEGVTAAWGARAIVEGQGLDLVYNRQSTFGKADDVLGWLNGGALEAAVERANELIRHRSLKGYEREHLVLYEDDRGVVAANTNASYGYLYMAAWLKEDENG